MANYVAVDKDQLEADLTTVADAIRAKTGAIRKLAFPDGMAAAVASIQGGGDGGNTMWQELVTRTISGGIVDSTMTAIGYYAFAGCEHITSAEFTAAKSLGGMAFGSCTGLTNVDFPVAASIGANAFYGCTGLTNVDFPAVTSIGSDVFHYCTNLSVLVLRTLNQCSLEGATAFAGTQFDSGKSGGKLLVPAALVESYKTGSRWSYIYGYGTNKFLPLEEYTVDGTVTGALDWDKINAA